MDPFVDMRKLQMFVVTIREGSMRKASERLYVTPSAVSHGIRALELDLQTKLFERGGSGLEPTASGLSLYAEAHDILERMEVMSKRFCDSGASKPVQLHIGTTNTGCKYLVPAVIREFRESMPEAALKLEIGDTPVLLEKLHQRKVDILIAPIQSDYRELEHTELGSDELVYIVNPLHPWALAGRMNKADLEGQRLIVPALKSHTYLLIDAHYRRQKLPFEPFIEVNSAEVIKQLVTLNIGIGVVPRWIAEEEVERGALFAFQLTNVPLRRTWRMLHRPASHFEFPEFLFMEMTKSVAANLLDPPV